MQRILRTLIFRDGLEDLVVVPLGMGPHREVEVLQEGDSQALKEAQSHLTTIIAGALMMMTLQVAICTCTAQIALVVFCILTECLPERRI
jgi:hypothetical protein